MKYFFILIMIFFILPLVVADEKIIETEIKVVFDESTQNLTITFEKDSSTDTITYNINGSSLDETISFQFIRDVDQSRECSAFDFFSNVTSECLNKSELYDRIVGGDDLRIDINSTLFLFQEELRNYTVLATTTLNQCESEKQSCELQKNVLFTQADLDEAISGKVGYGWLAIIVVGIVVYFKKDSVFGLLQPRVVKNNPSLAQRPRKL